MAGSRSLELWRSDRALSSPIRDPSTRLDSTIAVLIITRAPGAAISTAAIARPD